MYEDLMQHSGILGMKWGVRRFQNKDGSLTPMGKLRYGSTVKGMSDTELTAAINKAKKGQSAKESAARKADKRKEREAELKTLTHPKKQSKKVSQKSNEANTTEKQMLKNMSDSDLERYVNDAKKRANLEKEYKALTHPKKTKAVNFLKSVEKQVIAPAAIDIGRQAAKLVLVNYLNNIELEREVENPVTKKKEKKKVRMGDTELRFSK